MPKSGVVILTCISVMFCLCMAVTAPAQTSCPAVGQINGINGQPNAGLQNGAGVTIEVVGSTLQAGDNMVQAAGGDWTKIQGAKYTFNVQNVDSVPSGSASASNPVIIFQIGPASDFAPGAACAGAFMCSMPSQTDSSGHVVIAQIEMNPQNTTNNTFFQEAFDHELGHAAFGLDDCDGCTQTQTIMASPATNSTDTGPTTCDQGYVYNNSGGAYGEPSNSGGSNPGSNPCPPHGPRTVQDLGCNPSPIIIDVEEEGFHLTSADGGVMFDIAGDGHPIQIAWTDPRFHNAFLALPSRSDGLVHNGKELFGNFTPQPPSQNPNGFIALAEYDKPENGGNGDGIIDDRDEVFSQLRLWIDENHDGICQPNELYRLPELGIYSLSLSYGESRRTDQYGNQFRYRGKVDPGERRDPRDETPTGQPGRWEYDVFLVAK